MINARLVGLVLVALLSAAGLAPAVPTNAQAKNSAPETPVIDIAANDADPATPGVQVSPAAGASRAVTVTFTVDDDNGHNDLKNCKVTVKKGDGAGHRAQAAATKTAGNGKRASCGHSFTMSSYDAPGTYTIEATAEDRDSATSSSSLSFTYQSLAAQSTAATMTVSGGSSVEPGTNTTSSPASITVSNTGNVVIDLQFSGTNLAGPGGASIPVGAVRFSLASDATSLRAGTPLSGSAYTLASFDLAPGTSSSKATYFAVFLDKQSNLPAGTYAGSMTVTAVANT